jgi:hypothetical protein
LNAKDATIMVIRPMNVDCQSIPWKKVYPTLRKIIKNIWRKSEVQNKKDDEDMASEIDEVEKRIMIGKTSNKEYKN